MNIFKAAGEAISGSWKRFRLTGIASAWTVLFGLLSGTKIDYRRELGRVDDNTAVSSGRDWLWKQTLYTRLIVAKKGELVRKRVMWEEVEGHAFAVAWENGPYYDHTVQLHGILTALLCDGNAFLRKVRSAAGLVVGFAILPTDAVEVRNDLDNADGSKLITHYRYFPPGSGTIEDIAPSEVVHLKWGFDAHRMGMGLSPLRAALREIYGENVASTVTTALIKNGGLLGIGLSPKTGEAEAPTPAKRKEIVDSLRRASQGDLAGGLTMLPFPAELLQIGQSPDKLVIDKTRGIQISRICACLGLDPMVLGLPSESKTYSNYAESIEAAFENTILPILQFVAIQFTHQCLRADFGEKAGVRVSWDTSEVPALQDDEDKLWLRVGKAYREDELITLNEARGLIRFDPDPKGEVYFSDRLNGLAQTPEALKRAAAARAKKRRGLLEDLGLPDGLEDGSAGT